MDSEKAPGAIIIIDDNSSGRGRMERRGCCFCVPEVVGVFAILSMNFFLGIFYAAYSFMGLGYVDDGLSKAILSISGCLHTLLAIISALGISAIRKEKVIMMRRISIAFWILTVLMLIFTIILFIGEVSSKSSAIEDCKNQVIDIIGDSAEADARCTRSVNESLAGEGLRYFITMLFSVYFAHVVFRFTKRMKEGSLPFTNSIAPSTTAPRAAGFSVYATQPPTSDNWSPPAPVYSPNAPNAPNVPNAPPVYTVRTTNGTPNDNSNQNPITN